MESRSGVSVLHALGMPELVTADLEAYRRMVLEFGRSPDRLRRLRARVERLREQSRLFDLGHFVEAVEEAYMRIWGAEEVDEGLKPIVV